MKKLYSLMTLVALLCGSFSSWANVEILDTAADSIISATDTISDPEWYVAPVIPDSLRAPFSDVLPAPRRAKMAAACLTDSILTFNIDSVLTEGTYYDYDAAGHTIRTTVWTYNADGSRVGKSKNEYGFTGSTQTMTATYAWDNTTNDWKGTSKNEYVYEGAQMTSNTSFTWINNDWMPDTRYTYAYDASNREIEYIYYTRNTSTNELVPNKSRIQEWYNASKRTLEILYTAHNGTAWSAGTKKVYNYDAKVNQTLYEYYSSYNNGSWIGSTREVWEFLPNTTTKTYYEKQTWSNGAWTNSTKELWTFNASNKQTQHEKYSWSNSNWSLTLQENSGYDAAGNNILVENYNVSNGVFTGSKKEEYTYNAAKKKTGTITYKWTNGAWVYNQWTVSDYDAAGNATETCKYNWTNGTWVGSGTRTLKTYNSAKKVTEQITQTWPANATDWVNKTCTTTVYSGANKIQEAYYTWSNDAWLGTSRKDYHYNSAGKNDTIKTYTNNGTDWVYSSRTVNTYNASGTNIMTHNAKWQNNAWVMTSMTRTDISDITVDGIRQTLNASWKCNADSVWIGVQKDTSSYWNGDLSKQTFTAHYTSWANNDWVPSYRVEIWYDEAGRDTVNQRFEWMNNGWKGYYRYEHQYNGQGKEIMMTTYSGWEPGTSTWSGTSKYEYTYDANSGNKIGQTSYSWENGTWEYFLSHSYQYDAYGHEILQIVQRYDNDTWVNSDKYEKEYNGSVQVKNNTYIWASNQWQIYKRSEITYDEDAQAKLRRDITGSWSTNGNVSSYTDKHYFYACDPHFYTIRFVNFNGAELSSESILGGQTPAYEGTEPTKPEDSEYTYTFSGWTPTIVPATANATYTATYTSTKRSYTITWLNEDGTEISHETLEYGATPAHANINKESSAEYTYTFAGWTPGIGIVTGDATYTATFSSTKNSYTITFKNGEQVLQSTAVEYGTVPVYNGTTPIKNADAQYTYTYAGWDAELASVTGEATYNAVFSSNINSYTITWLNDDNSLIDETTVAYGVVPTHDNATKANTAEWTYTFTGWDNTPVAVTGVATYKATYSATKNSYTVTFKNGEQVLQSTSVEYGTVPTYSGATPTKPADAENTYIFTGWDAELASVTGEATYNAVFSSNINSYLVTFKNGEQVLQSTAVEYGEMPNYTGAEPTKPADAENTYTFTGWDAELASVTGEATYNAVFSSNINSYLVTFKDENGATLDSKLWQYGATPTCAEPTKQSDAQYTYAFAGWDKEIASVTAEAIYTATYSSTLNSYTITFKNGEQVLQSTAVEYGTVPVYNGTTPIKNADAQYTYTYAGWDAELASVTGEATYNAVFSSSINAYTITWLNDDNSLIDETTVAYGVVPTHDNATKANTAEWTYTFTGWDNTPVAVTGVATYKATYSATKNSYTVTFKNGEETLQSTSVEYGEMPNYTGAEPTKQGDAENTYTFTGWDAELASVTGEATYNAVFSSNINAYTITWLNDDNSLIDETTVAYGVVPTHDNATKANTAEYTYTFTGWDNTPVAVTGVATYKATYSATKNSYTVTFKNGEQVLQSTSVEYGEMPNYTGAEPTKPADAENTYTFTGWDAPLTAVTGNATYTATFVSNVNTALVTFMNGEEVLQSTAVTLGTVPAYNGATPTKEGDAQYTYTFVGWDREITSVTGEATYTAVFDQTIRTYTVTFYFEDGTTVLDRMTLPYGQMPSTTYTPSRSAEEHCYYSFAGWYPELAPVTGDVSYTPTYVAHYYEYTIIFKNYDRKELQRSKVPYGTTPSYDGDEPTRPRTAQYTYSFAGWSPELTAVEGDATYTAVYDATLNSYTIIFVDEDGTELDRAEVEYGTVPTTTVTPTKEEDDDYTYTFAGWSPKLKKVTGDATYTATYKPTAKTHESLDDVPVEQPARKVLIDDMIYILRGGKTYTVTGALVE